MEMENNFFLIVIKIRQHKKMNLELFINYFVFINRDTYQLIPNVEDAWDFFYILSLLEHVINMLLGKFQKSSEKIFPREIHNV